jgi:hypothetical protein
MVRRVLPAPPAAVWEEWLDAEGMAEWMCPPPHGDEQTLMTIHHAKLPPDVLDSHQNGWVLIGKQLGDWLTRRGQRTR